MEVTPVVIDMEKVLKNEQLVKKKGDTIKLMPPQETMKEKEEMTVVYLTQAVATRMATSIVKDSYCYDTCYHIWSPVFNYSVCSRSGDTTGDKIREVGDTGDKHGIHF
ncbi:Hypothetical predicted protein [Octopus vulgaris]|uniref:Uncharacterized protein n=1 Tax=Octopus vulgaris TaxID=6645 RepID=A0AA36AH84_OCTVU|nr:Hypothetical predicted protein [Octopus vulgaris]